MASACVDVNGPTLTFNAGIIPARKAPTAAPPATPNVHGSANGLRNRTCKAAPVIASAPPTSKATATRGIRWPKKINPSTVSFPPRCPTTAAQDSTSAPNHGNPTPARRKATP